MGRGEGRRFGSSLVGANVVGYIVVGVKVVGSSVRVPDDGRRVGDTTGLRVGLRVE